MYIRIFALSVAMLVFPAASVSAQVTCPQKGEVPITDATRAAATAAGIPTTATCWNPSNPFVGQEAADAKIYLKTILCKPDGDNYGGAGPEATIDKLNPKFAECAAKFLKAASGQVPGQVALRTGGGNGVCIKEGFRTVEKQNQYVRRGVIACTKGANCEHPRGIAIDVNTNSDAGYSKLHQMAAQFGVNFYLGFKDKYHFVPRSNDCSTAGYQPNDLSSSSTASPTSNFTNAIRQALTPLMAAPAQPAPVAPSQPLPATQSPTNAFTLPTPEILPTVVVASSSIADRLEDLAFGTTTTTSSATSVPLVIDTRDVGGIQSSLNSSQQPGTTVTGGSVTQNTFVTQDLNWSNSTASQSSFQRTLSTLQSILVQLLQYVQPFRSRTTGEVLE